MKGFKPYDEDLYGPETEETIIDQWQSQIFARVMLKPGLCLYLPAMINWWRSSHDSGPHHGGGPLTRQKAMVNKEDYK